MVTEVFVPFLAFATLLSVAVHGYLSAQRTEQRRMDPDAPKSTLAADQASDAKPVDV